MVILAVSTSSEMTWASFTITKADINKMRSSREILKSACWIGQRFCFVEYPSAKDKDLVSSKTKRARVISTYIDRLGLRKNLALVWSALRNEFEPMLPV
jgi:hypothetical protein